MVAPPGGSDFPLWPLPQDQTFCYGPSRGIGLSDVAPPGGSDFPMWPLLQDRILRCGPPHGIDGHTVGSFEYSFKGTVYEKCVYGRTLLPKAYNIHALDLL